MQSALLIPIWKLACTNTASLVVHFSCFCDFQPYFRGSLLNILYYKVNLSETLTELLSLLPTFLSSLFFFRICRQLEQPCNLDFIFKLFYLFSPFHPFPFCAVFPNILCHCQKNGNKICFHFGIINTILATESLHYSRPHQLWGCVLAFFTQLSFHKLAHVMVLTPANQRWSFCRGRIKRNDLLLTHASIC